MKAALVNICSDNLGANSTLGLCESFNAAFYCRICECAKTECQKSVSENIGMVRSATKYSACMEELINGGETPDFKKTRGLKGNCSFNELKDFHGFENFSVDIMHDLLEGVIPSFIKLIFDNLKKSISFLIRSSHVFEVLITAS